MFPVHQIQTVCNGIAGTNTASLVFGEALYVGVSGIIISRTSRIVYGTRHWKVYLSFNAVRWLEEVQFESPRLVEPFDHMCHLIWAVYAIYLGERLDHSL